MLFRARQFEFHFPRPALVMGIINVTPDSFSDGGRFCAASAAVEHGLKLVGEGADILDIGGESSRPGAAPVAEAEELCRVIPVIEQLAAKIKIPISIDTAKPGVARAALAAGAALVNDVAANRNGEAMGRVVAAAGAGYVAMHAQGTPTTMQENPCYTDIVREVDAFFGAKLEELGRWNVAREQVILDPGIGFGKGLEHNLQLLAGLRSFTRWQRPVLLGVSRKSFMGKLLGAEVAGRAPASLACAVLAVASGAGIIRTHDVVETVQALRMAEAILAQK